MPAADIFPSELRKIVPPLHSQEHISDPVVHVRFLAGSGWTWYVTEGSPENDDFVFFGFVIGPEEEWGYFSLSELTEAGELSGHPIERDLLFERRPFSEVVATRKPRMDSRDG